MKITKKGLKYLLAKNLYRASLWFDNSENSNFNDNGESRFISELIDDLKNEKQITLFDIGANKGDYTQILFDKVRNFSQDFTIHLFEPTHSCFSSISNRFNDERIVLNNHACSDTTGEGEIFYDSQSSPLASMYQRNLKHYGIQLNLKEKILKKRLDYYIEEHIIKHIHFIKIDVEGHEMAVINGLGNYLNSDFIDYLQFEYGGTNLDSTTPLMRFFELFEAKGFKLTKVMPDGLQIREYEPFLETFRYSNYVAISERLMK